MADWNPAQYLKFEVERTRAASDLLAQIPSSDPRRVVDVGCGPGNSTELLLMRWPQAFIIGVDTSAEMLRQARERLPEQRFVEANIAHWNPPEDTDVIFANAIFQWVPQHIKHMARLIEGLQRGGVLAVQMPDNLDQPSHMLMREVARLDQWRAQLASAVEARDMLAPTSVYYDALRPLCSHFEIWHTVYNHVMDDVAGIVEWVKGTGLRPFLEPLEMPQRKEFLAEYSRRLSEVYLPQVDGKILLRFPRMFIVAVK